MGFYNAHNDNGKRTSGKNKLKILLLSFFECMLLVLIGLLIYNYWNHPKPKVDPQPIKPNPEKTDDDDSETVHHYKIFNIKDEGLTTYGDCEIFCENRGGHLAVINSKKENEHIYKMVIDSGLHVAFFGYSDESAEGKWKWVYGDSHYSNWNSGQPNNGGVFQKSGSENYAEFSKEASDGTWNDAPFGKNTYRFICEWEHESDIVDPKGTIEPPGDTDDPAGAIEPQEDDYVIPDSDRTYLYESDLQGLSKEELRLARNEIYARKGRIFDDETLRSYFASKKWYRGTIKPDEFNEKELFNDYEYQNACLIRSYEIEHGYLKAN